MKPALGLAALVLALTVFPAGCNKETAATAAPKLAAAVDGRVAKGADVNARATGQGWSGRHYAVADGNADAVDALVRKGAKVDVKDPDGLTPLQLARSASAPAKTPEQEEEDIKALAK